jgi:hypothetical protein
MKIGPCAMQHVMAGAGLLLAALADAHFLTRIDVKVAGDPGVGVQTFLETEAIAFTNTSDRALRCRADFFKGLAPEGRREFTIPPRGTTVQRSPISGAVSRINVETRCA